jgi:hypothetical protein
VGIAPIAWAKGDLPELLYRQLRRSILPTAPPTPPHQRW